VEVLGAAGLSTEQATKASTEVAPGVVMSQSPEADTEVPEGTTVTITVSTGPAPEPDEAEQDSSGDSAGPPATPEAPPATPEVPPAEPPATEPEPDPKPEPEPSTAEVPDLIGMRVLEALRALSEVKLQAKIEWGPSEDILVVTEQDPSAGTDVDPGTTVTITIGLPEFLFDDVQVQPLPSAPPEDAGDSEGASEATGSAQ
jgi:beta-lactam-binding protein with PASTA domain